MSSHVGKSEIEMALSEFHSNGSSSSFLKSKRERRKPVDLSAILIASQPDEPDRTNLPAPHAGTNWRTEGSFQGSFHAPSLRHETSYLSMDGELHHPPDTMMNSPMRSPHHRRSFIKMPAPSHKKELPSSPAAAVKRHGTSTSKLFEMLERHDPAELEADETISHLIMNYPFFNEFSLSAALHLAKLCQCKRLNRGEVLFKQEDVSDDAVYLILQGSISLRTDSHHGNRDADLGFEDGLEQEKNAPALPPPLPRQHSKEIFNGRNGLNVQGSFHGSTGGQGPSVHTSLTKGQSFNSAGFDVMYGTEVGTLSQGDVYGERVFQDQLVQNTLHSSTGIVISHGGACALRLSRSAVERAGMIAEVHSRVTYITRTAVFDGLRKRLSITPEERDRETVNFILSALEFMPFFMHLRDSGALPEIARNITLEETGVEKKILWHEGSTTSDERYIMHVILDGEVHHYAKGSSVNPLDIRALDWENETSIERTLGKMRFVSRVGNVVGGPTQFGISTGDTVVAAPNTVFGRIDRAAWKPALSSLNRSFSCRPQHIRRLLAAVMSPTDHRSLRGQQRDLDDVTGAISIAHELASNLRDGIEFFEQVPFDKLEELCVNFRLLKVCRNEALCIAGQPSRGVFVIFTGSADAHTHPRGMGTKSPDNLEWARILAAQGIGLPAQKNFFESSLDPTPFFGPKVREVVPGCLVFSGNAEHTWSQTLLAGDTPVEAIYIETATYIQLISPSQTPMAAVSLHEAMEKISIDPGDRTFDQREEIAAFLRTLPELRRMDSKMLVQLSHAVSLQTFDTRDVICQQGQMANIWFGLLQGSISFHLKNSKSPEVPQTPGSNVVFKYGACFRVGFPGETFGQSSMLLKSDFLVTAVCREPCRLFVIPTAKIDPELFEHVTASSRLLLGNSEAARKPARMRTETEILFNVNYLRDNPFFSHLNDVSLQKLAISVQSLEFRQDETVCDPHNQPPDNGTRMMVVNRGTVCCFGPPTILRTLRLQPAHAGKNRETKRKSVENLEDVPPPQEMVPELATAEFADSGTVKLARLESVDPSWEMMQALQAMDSAGASEDQVSDALTRSFASSSWGLDASMQALSSPFAASFASVNGRAVVQDLASTARVPSVQTSAPSIKGVLGLSTRLHFARTSSRKAFTKQVVAAYGQAFWSTFPCSAEDPVEVLVVSRRKWKSVSAGSSAGENQEVVSFLQAHPCFQRSKNTEQWALLSQGRLITLEPNSILFREGDVVGDVFFLRRGAVELRTGIELGRGTLSAGDNHFIPSVVVASLSTNAVINQVVPGLGSMLPGEGALQWGALAESFTAVATCRTTVIALGKSQMLLGPAEDRRERVEVLERLTSNFHPRRIAEIVKARHGMMHGDKVEPWHASVFRDRRDLRDVIANLQHKQFTKKQPPVFSHVKAPVSPESKGPGTLAAVLSPRVDCLKLPRVSDRRAFHLRPSLTHRSPPPPRFSPRRSLDSAADFAPGRSSHGLPPGGLRLLQSQLAAHSQQGGPSPRDAVLRHGRPPRIASIHKPLPERHPAMAKSSGVKLKGQAMPHNAPPLTIQDLLRESKAESRQHPLKPYMRW